MASALQDVILHVYQLFPDEGGSFVSRFLPSMGMGAYHTSLEVDGRYYSFAARQGIVQTRSRDEGLPVSSAEGEAQRIEFKQSIPLGACACSSTALQSILEKLRKTFHDNAYHLVHRNCNHFTETLATCCIAYHQLVDMTEESIKSGGKSLVTTYPAWINRLANTGRAVVAATDGVQPTDVFKEARFATGAEDRISWDLSPKTEKANGTASKKKKELTDKQKAILAKLKGNGKK